jgi:ferredoxin
MADPASPVPGAAAVTLRLDGREVAVPSGATILEAARVLGIAIPTLCHRQGLPPFTACMACVVEVEGGGRLVPACSAPAEPGMSVLTGSPAVLAARRGTLGLLLGEHVGDCDGPCQGACPADLDIPAMLRAVAAGDLAAAVQVVRRRIPLAATLGRVCPAPCEKACRRGRHDAPVAIRLVKRWVGDAALAAPSATSPPPPSSGTSVAVVGTGPAGLAAAWFLRQQGHAVTLFEAADAPGGGLRHGCPCEILPADVLAREIAMILDAGIALRLGVRVGADVPWDELRADFAAVVVAIGQVHDNQESAKFAGIDAGGGGRDRHTGAVGGMPGFFLAGDALRPTGHLAVRAVGDGHRVAVAVDQFLRGQPVVGVPHHFHSRLGLVEAAEMAELMKEASPRPAVMPSAADGGLTPGEAAGEAARCLHCDCRKAASCRLREQAEDCGANARHHAPARRPPFTRNLTHPDIVHEPGKCICCGLCVRITRAAAEPVGMAFLGRGNGMRVAPPCGEGMAAALGAVARDCVEACPTGALAWRQGHP